MITGRPNHHHFHFVSLLTHAIVLCHVTTLPRTGRLSTQRSSPESDQIGGGTQGREIAPDQPRRSRGRPRSLFAPVSSPPEQVVVDHHPEAGIVVVETRGRANAPTPSGPAASSSAGSVPVASHFS